MFASVQARNATLRFYTIRRTSRGSVMYEDGIVEREERVLTTSQVFTAADDPSNAAIELYR